MCCKYSRTDIQYVSKLLIERLKVIGNVYGGASRCACALARCWEPFLMFFYSLDGIRVFYARVFQAGCVNAGGCV